MISLFALIDTGSLKEFCLYYVSFKLCHTILCDTFEFSNIV